MIEELDDLTLVYMYGAKNGRDSMKDEIERLRAALEKLIAACDAGRRYEKSSGGMTIEAQLARTVIYGVSASAVEDARAALEGEKTND
jgi:hypothetical protein